MRSDVDAVLPVSRCAVPPLANWRLAVVIFCLLQVVLLLNAGDSTTEVKAHWKDIGLAPGIDVKATDLWTGKSFVPSKGTDSVSAIVPTHDVAAFRLTPT